MWKLLYQLAAPKLFYRLSGKWIPWIAVSVFIVLTIGVIWGLVFAPADYQQGDAFRIIYVHVPCAFLSMALFAWMGFFALLLLVWRIKMAGIMLNMCAQTGACMTFLALVTGSIWGKPMWGTWWVWDARLTSELILLFLYGAILAVSNAYQNKEQGDKIVAILTLVGLIDLPIIHYSVYWWNTLHQGSTLSVFAKPKIATSMIYPLLIMLVGFSLYCLLIILLKVRNEILLRERRQNWVRAIVLPSSTLAPDWDLVSDKPHPCGPERHSWRNGSKTQSQSGASSFHENERNAEDLSRVLEIIGDEV